MTKGSTNPLIWVETDILPPPISGTLSAFEFLKIIRWPMDIIALNSHHTIIDPGCFPE